MSQPGTGEHLDKRDEPRDRRPDHALEPPARHEAVPVAKSRRAGDGYAAVIAALIGMLALAVSGYTAYLQRQQLRAQVWPLLQIMTSNVNMLLWATNQGTGPARVMSMRVTVDGTPLKTWDEFEHAAGFTDGAHMLNSWLSKAVLSPGKEFTILQPRDDELSRTRFKALLSGRPHAFTMTVCYCSVLDECWVAVMGTGDGPHGVPSETCPVVAAERFTQ